MAYSRFPFIARRQKADSQAYREIENHFAILSLAENTEDLVKFQRDQFALNAKQAKLNIEHNNEITDAIRESLGELISSLSQEFQGINNSIQELNWAIEDGFSKVTDLLYQQQATLGRISATLESPYGTKVQELRIEAVKWLKLGMQHTGRDQQEDYKDAVRLFEKVIANPIGRQDYVTLFQRAWLYWQYDNDLSKAEEAFYRAARLSSATKDSYYIESLRHQAYVCYLQGKHQEAWEIAQKAKQANEGNLFINYDLARYSVCIGQREPAIELLEKCVRGQSNYYCEMFAENDFLPISKEIAALATNLLDELKAKVGEQIKRSNRTLEIVEQTMSMAGLSLQHDIEREILLLNSEMEKETEFYQLISLINSSFNACKKLQDWAKEELEKQEKNNDQACNSISAKISDLEKKKWDIGGLFWVYFRCIGYSLIGIIPAGIILWIIGFFSESASNFFDTLFLIALIAFPNLVLGHEIYKEVKLRNEINRHRDMQWKTNQKGRDIKNAMKCLDQL